MSRPCAGRRWSAMLIDEVAVAVLGLAAAVIAGMVLIPHLRRLKIGQNIRSDGPKSHQSKVGTPTMGGLIFIVAAPAAHLVHRLTTSRPVGWEEALLLAFPALYAIVGFVDDYRKVRKGRSLGLRAREKMALQILFAALFMYAVSALGRGTTVTVPFTGAEFDLGIFYGLFGILVIVSSGNGVNLTDGLDGLATGTTLLSLFAFLYIAGVFGSLPGAPDLTGPILAWIGSLFGFLWYNRHPARVFMGDTGSNALGALLSGIAILTRTELVLLLIAGIPVVETVSDILQVASFQLFGRRIFKMAPLHHHFELCGMSETSIVWGFWIAQAAMAVLGVLSMSAVK